MDRDELLKKIAEKGTELNCYKRQLFDAMKRDSNDIVAYNTSNSFCLKIYINQLEISIAFRFTESFGMDNNSFDIPYHSIDDIRIYNSDHKDISNDLLDSDSISSLHVTDSLDLINLLNELKGTDYAKL